ncbi:hypothetical protein [Denitrobaculum tricleocarpae]|uniref:DUF1376 domain-containing protein n=1 Tax=Denitrobaculum tricleocarpae TaxID=2591009 RepID=A0A545TSZ2_9PROT|nr:hypothetical protein [Denitrobaculum tricleocarpae]TQV80332.1 hypothetical protein FKG95_09055 [Denitrobaculum tricleocarpae]
MSKQQYILPKGWKDFQHYKDRDPKWIKLHLSLLNDYKFRRMTETQQLICIKLWLLFAEQNQDLALDTRFISGRMGISSIVLGRVISVLVSNDFIELVDKPASEVLAERYQNASPKRVRDKNTPIVPSEGDSPDLQECLDTWNTMAKANGLPTASLTDKRRKALRARLKDHGLEDFAKAVQQIPADAFRLGKNDRRWKANIDYLLRPDSITKLLEEIVAEPPEPEGTRVWCLPPNRTLEQENRARAAMGKKPMRADGSIDEAAPDGWGDQMLADFRAQHLARTEQSNRTTH